jgi:uridylate kinase
MDTNKNMKQKKEDNIIVVSVGGSLIVPEEINTSWIKEFYDFVLAHISKGYRFIIITGGGKTARKYQNAAKKISNLDNEDLDWIGIHSTRLNAHLFRTIFRDYAHKEIIKDPTKKINFKEKILIAAGWRPGCSTDYDAVLLAKQFKSKNLINLTNIDYVYDKDPRKFSEASIIKTTSWKDFRKIVGNKWDPGLNAPFDPIAAKESQKIGLEVAIINGKDLKNLDNYINKKEFIGTIIR